MKTRTLYYRYHQRGGLQVLVTKVRGEGMLKSYGADHQTELDDLLDDEGFNVDHDEGYLDINNNNLKNGYNKAFHGETDYLKAIDIVSRHYNCSERVKLTHDEFDNLLFPVK